MRRIQTLILSLITLTFGTLAQAQSQGDVFNHYHAKSVQNLSGNLTSPEYWSARYQLQRNVFSALQDDVRLIFKEYLQGKLISFADVSGPLDQDAYLKENFPIASSTVIMEESIKGIERTLGEIELVREIKLAHAANQLIPLHFRVFDDETAFNEGAYFERGTHKVKMALDKIDRENWLTWFVHEHLHFFDSLLRSAEERVNEANRLNQIANWVRTHHRDLSPKDAQTLNEYFSDLTNISIQAEWRAWIATSLFAQKLLASGGLKSVPPCLSFLDDYGFGTRTLTEAELKTIWWTKLRAGFFVEETGLFTDPWLKAKLLEFTALLDSNHLPTGNLSKLVE